MAEEKRQEAELKKQRSDMSGSLRRRSTIKKMATGVGGMFKNNLRARGE